MNDQKNGKGTMRWPDGYSYTGSWKSGKQHGSGVVTKPNGEQMKAEFKEGRQVEKTDAKAAS